MIARGGMGEVYLAATTGIEGAERPCVVKIIRREHAKDASFLARFLDEARVQSQLSHSGVVQIFEASKDESGEPFVAVEYVEGRSLGEVRARCLQVSFRLAWADAVALSASTAEALAHVHERVDVRGNPLGIVHRDLSPQNIMVSYGGDVKLIDFGTARGENRRCHTVSGVVFAKPGYVAPEVANGKSGDCRVDLYALGVMLWELVAGRRFLQGDATEHLAAVSKNQRTLPPIAQIVGAPARLDEIIAKLTAYSLEERYGTAREALSALAGLLSTAPSLSNGERGVRARIGQLMLTLYPSEPTRSRQEFARLVVAARKLEQQPTATPTLALQPEIVVDEESDASLLPGTRYRVIRKIGNGAMGAVYEAEHVDLGRRVALKVLAAEHATSPEYAARFRREARALSRLSNPNLVTLHDFGQTSDGRLFCAMELLEGETLEGYLQREGAADWRLAVQMGIDVAEALNQAHAAGLVHRDLKPSNLFLCLDGSFKLLDFGLVKMADEAGEPTQDKSSLTLFGTPEYMAPEQILGTKVDERADIYALGCVLYELCTGRRPFEGPNAVSVLDAKQTRMPEGLRERAPSRAIPAEVDRIVMRCLAREPENRFANAEQLIEKLRGALRAPERSRERRRNFGRAVVALALGVAVLVGAGAAHRRHPQYVQTAVRTIAPHLGLSVPVDASIAQTAMLQAAPDKTERAVAPAVEPQESSEGEAAKVAGSTQSAARQDAENLATRRDWNGAIESARRWVDEDNTQESRVFLARLLVHASRCDEARVVIDEVLKASPSSVEARALGHFCRGGSTNDSEVAQGPRRAKSERSRLARSDRR
jgi:serine/threonine-protein kinase